MTSWRETEGVRTVGSVVARWTGREARAFREAKRMSVREFAAHLGVNDAAVSNWERRGDQAKLRYDTQQLLDTDLTRSGAEVADRFELILRSENTTESSGSSTPQNEAVTADGDSLGDRSGPRTIALLDATPSVVTGAAYQPEQSGIERFRQFLGSQARVFVLTGGTGSGKSLLTEYLARRWSEQVDFQLHTCPVRGLATTSLATEVLRYASLPGGEDALLTLERVSGSLKRTCVVVIDGVDTEEQLTVVGQQVDGLLRQVNSHRLRFLLVARTPPVPDLSPFPVLAAAVFGYTAQSSGVSHSMAPWTPVETRELWNRVRRTDQVPFDDLPESLQSLARTPLYMEMLRSAEGTAHVRARPGTINAFRLVDHCVRTVLGRNSRNIDLEMDRLTNLACELMPEAVPGLLANAVQPLASTQALAAPCRKQASVFVEHTPEGRQRFTHDVFRDYFLAVRIAGQMTARGRSVATVAAFNDLADHAARSASARGVFDFAVCAIDYQAPNLIEGIAMAPSIGLDTALPMLLETTAVSGGLASAEVVRACAHRCTQASTRRLARALLATPNLEEALGGQYAPWLVRQLRIGGFEIWNDVAHHLEEALDIRVSTLIADCSDLECAEEAAFLARYFDLFTDAGRDHADLLQQLLQHLDWRVRAGLAEALLERRALSPAHVDRIVEHLVHDDDYKVRAAVARAVGTLDASAVHGHVQVLLGDSNWHVRERTLQGLLAGPQAPLPNPELAHTAIIRVDSDKSWDTPPASAAKLLARMRLLSGGAADRIPPREGGALFGLLREVRTGWIDLPPDLEQSLVSQGVSSSHWLTVREAHAVQTLNAPQARAQSTREHYRRRRGQRSIQVALDVHNLDRAVAIATASATAGIDFLEVGDPLIKRAGVAAIETVKRHAPETFVVAEMMSADWGRDQVELAAEAGADVVLLIGPASIASVSAAVSAARRLGVALTLDVTPERLTPSWLRDMERAGVDGFVITTNIDLGVGGDHPLAAAGTIRTCSRLPVAVSGGFSPVDEALTASDDWDIAIVGRGVADAVAPADMARQLTTIVHKIHIKERS